MKRFITSAAACAMSIAMLAAAPACAQDGVIDTSAMDVHKIGVAVYSLTEAQVISFREYLEQYIANCFEDVQFVYSTPLTDKDQELQFIQDACDYGVEGILSFSSYDLAAEVDLCAKNNVYYIRAASSESAENFAKVADNEYFLGAVGPGTEMEYEAGYNMGKYFAEQKDGNEYFILSGGAGMGVEMHVQRTQGILDALAESYGVTFDTDTRALASAAEGTPAQAGDLKVFIQSGFMENEDFLKLAQDSYAANPFGIVLSVAPVDEMAGSIKDAKLGMIDSYNTRNLQLFTSGQLSYLTGKFSSTIGPSFAAMYNAVTGYAADFRESDGKAFEVTQGFWTSDSMEDFQEKYTLSSSIAMNAYSAEDLAMVCKRINPDATLEDLKKLAGAYTFEDAKARRGLE